MNTSRGPGHPGKTPRTSQVPPFETQGRQTFEGGQELFDPHPFAWKAPTPPGGLRTQKVNLCALFSLRLLNALNSEDRGLKVRFSLATIAFDRESAQMSQILSSQGKNAPSNPYPHYLVRLAASRFLPENSVSCCFSYLESPNLPKEVRRFSKATIAFGVFPLSLPLAITAFGGLKGCFGLAIIAFGAFEFTVPKYVCRLGKKGNEGV